MLHLHHKNFKLMHSPNIIFSLPLSTAISAIYVWSLTCKRVSDERRWGNSGYLFTRLMFCTLKTTGSTTGLLKYSPIPIRHDK